jgi:hypothetical protein
MEAVLDNEAAIAIVSGEPFLQLPEDLYIPPEALKVFLETFEGPLDLLLYLIRKQNLDILNIPIAQISKQYMPKSSAAFLIRSYSCKRRTKTARGSSSSSSRFTCLGNSIRDFISASKAAISKYSAASSELIEILQAEPFGELRVRAKSANIA